MSTSDDDRGRGSRTRREFISDAAALAGGAALLGAGLIGGPPVHASSPGRAAAFRRSAHSGKKLGVALVGLGSYATGQLGPALEETQRCYLAGIVTGTPAKAEAWKQKYGIPEENVYNYETFDRVADNPDIDIIYVVLPNSMHAEYVIRAAQAGKHVITEKPMATSMRDCERMIDACREAGVKLSVGYRLHFDPFHQEMMRLGQEEAFGPVTGVEGSFSFRYRDTDAWRFSKEMAGGGALLDVGIYTINGARYVIGEEPVALRAQAFNTRPDIFTEIYETILWQMEFPGGAVSTHSTSYSGGVNRLYMMSERGWAELDPSYHYGQRIGLTSEGRMDYPEVYEQVFQMDDFAQCIAENRESRVSGEEGLRDMKVIEAIYRSIDAGGRVDV